MKPYEGGLLMNEDTQKYIKVQDKLGYSAYLEVRCYQFLLSLLICLDAELDRRLVQTFLALVMGVVIHRHRNQGLLLSELGGILLEPEHAPAGTKRISNLLHSTKWSAQLIEDFLWEQADRRVAELAGEGKPILIIWDESVIEKSESIKLEGLCSVRSSKARRLKRIKPGFYNPPGGRPICVPGYHWLQVLVLGMEGLPVVAQMRWWTTRGEAAKDRRTIERDILEEVAQRWGAQVIHIWDRGFAGNPWLTLAQILAVRFVMRWPKHYHLLNEAGQERKAWEVTRGKHSWEYRLLWDTRKRCYRKVGIFATPVFDKVHFQPLWLVVARPGQGREPWYLLTNQPINTVDQAWQVVFAYARRWQVEMSLRFDKCELAFESPRLRRWETQLRLLLMATLAYAFLLSLLHPMESPLIKWLFRHFCHRTGEWSRKVQAPLYRLRLAICHLWLTYPPPFLILLRTLTSG
jgi:hypothetical protein